MMKAREKYQSLTSSRRMFLDMAIEAAELTLPYLITDDLSTHPDHKRLKQPWQSVGAKAVSSLSAKLMLSLLPPQTSFFKLQIRDDAFEADLDPSIRSELDLSLSKMERMVHDYIAASTDRVVIHQAIKHLVVAGNALIFMGKEGLKNYPLNRFVVERDGNGNVVTIVTKELIHKSIFEAEFGLVTKPGEDVNSRSGQAEDDVEVYTHVRLDTRSGRWVWHQEAMDMVLPGTKSTAPKNASPWLVLRMAATDGESLGRGRVEEFIGDLRALESLQQSMCEGAAAASKVVFLLSPSSTTKPQTLANAGNGAIIQGRPEDVSVVQVGKQADMATAAQLAQSIEKRINEAFLVMSVRNAERVTAEEVRLTQLELERQIGNTFALLTVELLIPYLNRILLILQRSGQLPKIDRKVIRPQIVAGVNALGRGQDRESLTAFIQTIAQTLGPEALQQFVDPTEAIKRLAAAQGIDVLNLVKTPEQIAQQKQQAQQEQAQQALVGQAGALGKAHLMDPEKNPQLMEQMGDMTGQQQPPQPPPEQNV